MDNELNSCPNCAKSLEIAQQAIEKAINPPIMLMTDKGEYISQMYYDRLKRLEKLSFWGRIKWAFEFDRIRNERFT